MTKPTYLITGAAGFIGSRILEMLSARDATSRGRLIGLDIRSGADITADINDRSELDEVLAGKKFDAIIHLAARVGIRDSSKEPVDYANTNLIGTINLLEYCRNHKIPKFVYASTSSIYGADALALIPEWGDSSHPLQPYAASKKAAEVMCYAYHHLYGIDVSVLRYSTVYGPRGRPDMAVTRFIQGIIEEKPIVVYGSGEQRRAFVHVDDIARGTILALRPLGYEIINLGGIETIGINSLILMLEEIIGKRAIVEYQPANKADMFSNWLGIKKAYRLLLWEPRIEITKGLEETVEWYLKNIHERKASK